MEAVMRRTIGGNGGQVDVYGVCPECNLVIVVCIGSESYGPTNYSADALISFGENERQTVPTRLCRVCQRKRMNIIH